MHVYSIISLAALSVGFGLASTALAVTNVQDPSGKTVLVVDGDNIKADAAGKPILTIADDKISDANGNMVLYCNGDMLRDKPEGKLYIYIDGRHILRAPGGEKLLYVDGKNLMRGDRSGSPLYHFAGDDLDKQREMAVLYALMPELVTGSKSDAAILADQAKTGAASDADAVKNFAPGTYAIDVYRSADNSPDRRGTITVTQAGDVLAMDFQFKDGEAQQGVGIQHGDEIWAAVGPVGTVGLAVYTVQGGNLKGTWYNATGKPESFGSENATGGESLGGEYKITDAKAPFTLAPYTGTLTLEATEKKFFQDAPLFTAAWDLGGYKAKGVGFALKDSLALATSSGPKFVITRFKIDAKEGYLNGQFYTVDKVPGIWNLKKQK